MTPGNDSRRTRSTFALTLISAAFLIAGAHAAQAGINVWTSHGPYGGPVQALAIDPTTPSTLYAGTWGGGVFHSTNGGGSWSPVKTGLSDLEVTALAIDPHTPSTLYAGTDAGVFDIELTPPACLGDCNNDDHVTIDELLTLVDIALGNGGSCPYGLAAGVTPDVSVILHAVSNALNGCCAPTTCAAQGATCGTISDGCGGTVSCGTCTTPNTQGAQCGSVPDGCGGTLYCGTCTGSDTCGGGGTPNVCGAPTVSLEAFPTS